MKYQENTIYDASTQYHTQQVLSSYICHNTYFLSPNTLKREGITISGLFCTKLLMREHDLYIWQILKNLQHFQH